MKVSTCDLLGLHSQPRIWYLDPRRSSIYGKSNHSGGMTLFGPVVKVAIKIKIINEGAAMNRSKILLIGKNNAIREMQLGLEGYGFEVITAPCVNDLSPSTSVASILESDFNTTIWRWMSLVEQSEDFDHNGLSFHERTGHIPQLLRGLIYRLRLRPKAITSAILVAARQHGELRRFQGYTPVMLIEESRLLETSIFSTIKDRLHNLNLNLVLADVVAIADECGWQLKQSVRGYSEPGTNVLGA
jgi:hypothetical protein